MFTSSKTHLVYTLIVFFCITTVYAEEDSKPQKLRQIAIEAKIQMSEQEEPKPANETTYTINLMATENSQAMLEKGVEIALQGIPAVNQAATNEFHAALLRLHVLPRITDAGHILLEFELQMDEPMHTDYITFSKRRINTTSLIKNQSSALVGRIFEEKGKKHLDIKIYITPTILEQPL